MKSPMVRRKITILPGNHRLLRLPHEDAAAGPVQRSNRSPGGPDPTAAPQES